MRSGTLVRRTAAGALSAAAKAMAVTSKVTERAAGLVRPPRPGSARDDGGRRRADEDRTEDRTSGRAWERGKPRRPRALPSPDEPAQLQPAERGAVSAPPTETVPDVAAHARSPETHTEGIASRPASEVVSAVGDLSTDELRRLYEHETATKKRKTVLAAIERALAPNPEPSQQS